MSATDEQANWRVEFQEAGESEVRQNLLNTAIYNSPPKRDFARQWLREQERAREVRDQQIHFYTRHTFWAGVDSDDFGQSFRAEVGHRFRLMSAGHSD
jgi:hypothetical protein